MSGFSGSKIHKIKSLQVLGILTLALCVSACGGGSGEQTSSIAPINTPTDIKGTADAGNVVLSWSPVSGAESYNIYYSTDAALDIKNYAIYENGTWLRNVNSPYTISGLKVAPIYHFVVTAVSGKTESVASTLESVITKYSITGSNQDVIHDSFTKLEWQRCSLGQTWNSLTKNCDGIAGRYNVPFAFKYKTPNIDGWRLPTLDELQSLVYCSAKKPTFFVSGKESCSNSSKSPTIVQNMFPNTSTTATYHTSTPRENLPIGYVGYYDIYFTNGSIGSSSDNEGGVSRSSHIRLVRTVAP